MASPRPTSLVGISGIVVSLTGFLVMVVAARALSPLEVTQFMVYWAAFFFAVAILVGIQAEATRAVRAHGVGSTRLLPVALIGGLLVGATAVALVALMHPDLGPDSARLGVLAMLGVACLLYAGQAHTMGALAGAGRWTWYSWLSSGEATLRLLACLVVWVAANSVTGFEVAATVSVVLWLLLGGVSQTVREAWTVSIDLPQSGYVRRLSLAMGFAGAGALLINGFPLLMTASTPSAEFAMEAPLIVAVSLCRAPVMMPLVIFQSMIITAFVDQPHRAGAIMRNLTLAAVAVAIVGAVAAYVLGPPIMAAIFGADYRVAGWILAGLTVGAVALGLLTIVGAIALALDQHWMSTWGWYVALVIVVALLFWLPFGLAARTIVSLIVGPLTGAILTGVFLSNRLRGGLSGG